MVRETFDLGAFVAGLDRCLDDVLRELDCGPSLTIDQVVDVSRRAREYAQEQGAPPDVIAGMAAGIVEPFLTLDRVNATERAEILRQFSDAFGFEITLPH
jgi:hypothetical protein